MSITMADRQPDQTSQVLGGRPRRGRAQGPTGRETLSWMRRVAGRRGAMVAVDAVVRVAQAGAGLALAWLFGRLVDVAMQGRADGFATCAWALVATLAASVALDALDRYLTERSTVELENGFRRRLFATLLGDDLGQVQSLHSGEWMTRLTHDAGVVAQGLSGIVPGLAGTLACLVGTLAILFLELPRIAWAVIPVGAACACLALAFRERLKTLNRRQAEAGGRMRSYLLDRIQSLLVVHSFLREGAVLAQADDHLEDYRGARMRRANFSNLCNVGFSGVVTSAYVLGVCYCGWLILGGDGSYGTLVTVMALVAQLRAPFAALSSFVPQYYAALASAERLMEAERWKAPFAEPAHAEDELRALYRDQLDALELRDVTFSYTRGDDPVPVVRHLSLRVRVGEVVAFTGPSGCGKSTVLKLLMGIYPLDEGSSVAALRSGEELPLDARWRGLFAYVPQGNQLMSGTIREAVTFGDDDPALDAGVWEALRLACADEFVRGLGQGLDTHLGERGAGLSEGQVQRLAIARALYARHPVVLLDEATSSLDPATERHLLENLRTLTSCTTIVVTHRMEVLDACDRRLDFAGPGRVREVPLGRGHGATGGKPAT